MAYSKDARDRRKQKPKSKMEFEDSTLNRLAKERGEKKMKQMMVEMEEKRRKEKQRRAKLQAKKKNKKKIINPYSKHITRK